jgi:hypothetical protein
MKKKMSNSMLLLKRKPSEKVTVASPASRLTVQELATISCGERMGFGKPSACLKHTRMEVIRRLNEQSTSDSLTEGR